MLNQDFKKGSWLLGGGGVITREGKGCNSIAKEDLEIKMSRLLSWICMLPLT